MTEALSAVVKVGLIAPSPESRSRLSGVLPEGAIVVAQSDTQTFRGGAARIEFKQAQPEIALVEAGDPAAFVDLVSSLRQDLPSTWIFAVGEANEAQSVIAAVRAGVREFLVAPVSADVVREAVERYLAENPRNRRKAGKIFAVTSAKGGCGSTSVAINLAASMGDLPETRVALADLSHPLGDVAAYLGLKPKYTLNDALKAASRLDPVLLETFMTTKAGVHILAGQARIESSPESAWPVGFEADSGSFGDFLSFGPRSLGGDQRGDSPDGGRKSRRGLGGSDGRDSSRLANLTPDPVSGARGARSRS